MKKTEQFDLKNNKVRDPGFPKKCTALSVVEENDSLDFLRIYKPFGFCLGHSNSLFPCAIPSWHGACQ